MAIGIAVAVNKLEQLQIYCINPSKVLVGGRVNLITFDKTGTLTEEGM